jgi:hypothetical protein
MSSLPPQRMGPGGLRGGGPGGPGGRGPGQPNVGGQRNMTPAQGAQEAERRLGLPCYYAGQRVAAVVGCVACQFQINNRAVLPTCPQCGEIIWAYLGTGPRPIPEGEAPVPAPEADAATPQVSVQDGVPIGGDAPSVSVEEGIKLD